MNDPKDSQYGAAQPELNDDKLRCALGPSPSSAPDSALDSDGNARLALPGSDANTRSATGADGGTNSEEATSDLGSNSSSSAVQAIATSMSGRSDGDFAGGHELKNPKACLVELPDELLVKIFGYLRSGVKGRLTMAHLSRTSKALEQIANEMLYETIRVENGCLDRKVQRALAKKTKLGLHVKSVKWTNSFSQGYPDKGLRSLLRETPNVQTLIISERISYRGQGMWSYRPGNMPRETISGILGLAALKTLILDSFSIECWSLHKIMSIPSLENLRCRLSRKVTSTDVWHPLEPESQIQNLTLTTSAGYTMDLVHDMMSSIKALKYLRYRHEPFAYGSSWASGVSWEELAQALDTQKDALATLELEHCNNADIAALELKDFIKLKQLIALKGTYLKPLLDSHSLIKALPPGLEGLSINIRPTEANANQFSNALSVLKEHESLDFVEVYLGARSLPPYGQLQFSRIMEDFREADIAFEVLARGSSELHTLQSLQKLEVVEVEDNSSEDENNSGEEGSENYNEGGRSEDEIHGENSEDEETDY